MKGELYILFCRCQTSKERKKQNKKNNDIESRTKTTRRTINQRNNFTEKHFMGVSFMSDI